MAFTSAGGYGNLPNGNFSPIIYSKQVQLISQRSVVDAITNNDYFGEIAIWAIPLRLSKNQK